MTRDKTRVELPLTADVPPACPAGNGVSRRKFLKTGALVGGSAFVASQFPLLLDLLKRVEAGELTPAEAYELAKAENQLYTVCLQCNTGCPIKVKLLDGLAAKIDGSPLSPWTMHPHLPYQTPVAQLGPVEGAICPKGQAGIQSVYDPYRIRKVLKRAGKRGEQKWISIPFEQAVAEIVQGGALFANVPGEEKRHVQGLNELWALRDAKVAKDMAADAERVAEHKLTLAEFKAKHGAHLDKLIDPDHPDLGPKNNQIAFVWGRVKAGRGELIKRFTAGLGTVNAHGHTTVCQGSLYFTGKAMSEQYRFDGKSGMKWTGGNKFYWQADTPNSEFLIFVGASPFEANYGPPLRAPEITGGIVDRGLKIVVVDPRFSKTAAKAWKWVPARPGTEAAFALAMVRWIIDHRRFDARYLANANKAAANQDGELNWSNAAWLVKLGADGKPTTFLRASELGLPVEQRKAKVGDKDVEYPFDPFVVLKDGKPVPFDPYDTKNAVEGDLLVNTELQPAAPAAAAVATAPKPVRVKSSLQLLYDEASRNTLDGWAEICGVKAADIAEIALEFTRHGKRAAADVHRGVSQHTNGFYNVAAWMSLNLLIGNFDWKGGMIKATTYGITGGAGKPFDMDAMSPVKPVGWGISIIRHDAKYEKTTLFTGFPAKRPWYPLSSDIYQEIIPSAADAYPYPVKAMFIYMGSPVYSLPAGHTNIEALKDPTKIPLVIASDIVVGETSMYADYVFPDLSYLERWEFGGSHPNVAPKVQPVRQPVIAPLTETVKAFGAEQPLSLEAMLLGIAEKMKLPGFGKDAFGPGRHLEHPDDYYLPMVANLAFGDKTDGSETLPDADDAEMQLFLRSRRHLPRTVFDADRWRRAAGDRMWRKVVYVLNRGGRFQDAAAAYKGEQVASPYGTLINLYQEKTATTKHSMTGKNLPGVPSFIPPYQDVLGRPVPDNPKEYPLNLITYRVIQHTKSRTVADYWLLSIEPENGIILNSRDARALGLADGDQVKVVSASNPEGAWDLGPLGKKPMVGRLRVVQGLRPGVVGFSLGYGHWAYGAADVVVDGKVVKADPRRARGVHANAAMRVDPVLKNTCLVDVYGGSAVFYDTRVKLVKA